MLFKALKLEAKTRWPAYSWPHTRPHCLRKGEVYETTEGEGRRHEGGMAVSEPRGIPGAERSWRSGEGSGKNQRASTHAATQWALLSRSYGFCYWYITEF